MGVRGVTERAFCGLVEVTLHFVDVAMEFGASKESLRKLGNIVEKS
jgi:hypothetical protein